jgi:S1-C subfamily serine protease
MTPKTPCRGEWTLSSRTIFCEIHSWPGDAGFFAASAAAGFSLVRVNPGRAWWGDLRIEPRDGALISSSPLANTPAYQAGLDNDDVVRRLDGTRVSSSEDIAAVLRRHKPGDTIAVEFADRTGAVYECPSNTGSRIRKLRWFRPSRPEPR